MGEKHSAVGYLFREGAFLPAQETKPVRNDDKYIFIGDTLWFGADGGYSFISALAEDNKLAVKSLTLLEKKLKKRGLHPLFITGHTGWTDNMEFAFAHKNELCSPFKKKVHDPSAPYDAYDESDDTEENAKSGFLKGVGR